QAQVSESLFDLSKFRPSPTAQHLASACPKRETILDGQSYAAVKNRQGTLRLATKHVGASKKRQNICNAMGMTQLLCPHNAGVGLCEAALDIAEKDGGQGQKCLRGRPGVLRRAQGRRATMRVKQLQRGLKLPTCVL